MKLFIFFTLISISFVPSVSNSPSFSFTTDCDDSLRQPSYKSITKTKTKTKTKTRLRSTRSLSSVSTTSFTTTPSASLSLVSPTSFTTTPSASLSLVSPTSFTTSTTTPLSSTTFATYYFRMDSDVPQCVPVQNFNTGNIYGSCGQAYGPQSKYWVAIANGGSHCGRNILATSLATGNSITLTVMDTCPACQSDNHLDMGLEALIELTGSSAAACAINRPLPQISWKFL